MTMSPTTPDLTDAQIERRKHSLLKAAARIANPVFLHGGNPRDTEKAIADAVRMARQMLAEIDRSEPPQ